MKTKKEAGQLSVKVVLALASFTATTPVTIRVDDDDSDPIVQTSVPGIPAKGAAFQYKSKPAGVQQVTVKQRAPGQYQVSVKAKHWFTAAAANQFAGATRVTLTIGTQCFTHIVTKKTDGP